MNKPSGLRFGVLLYFVGSCLLPAAFCPAADPVPSAQDREFFEKNVRPVLVANCFKCHSGDKVKGELHLDSRAALLKGGGSGPAIVPGQPEKSRLIQAIGYKDDRKMPPRSQLAAQHIADLATWVKMGAPWPEAPAGKTAVGKEFDLALRKKHWCWQPVRKPALPEVKRGAWPESPIDYFILDRLEAKGLTPERPADRRTLIRRVTFDLIGLPPAPAEVEAFLADNSPAAYRKVVERLLASPHYGERWARHWLDLVRFAETHGHEFDFEIPDAYVYRDYLIRAFNADVPYHQFVVEHLAGDLLAPAGKQPVLARRAAAGINESILGTGFWFFGEAKHSPVDLRVDEADRIDNQLDVFSKAFLGLTVSCARCHDHKFDAISQKDYYALMGYLESSRYQRAYVDDPPQASTALERIKELQKQARTLAASRAAGALLERTGELGKYLLAGRPGADKKPVDPATLDRFNKAWTLTRPGNPEHLFYPWVYLGSVTGNEERFDAIRAATLARLKALAAKAADAAQGTDVFADFGRDGFREWFVTGQAFGPAPTRLPTIQLASIPQNPIQRLVPAGVAHSGLIANRLQGVIRSKTFIIPRKKILLDIAGKGAQVNLVIDGLQLIRDPIYGGLTFKVDHGDQLTWRAMDVSMWVGHKAYFEIIDDGPGFVAVDKILFADEAISPPPAPNYLILQMLDDPDLSTPELLAKRYQTLLSDTLNRWRFGELEPDDSDRVGLLNTILQSEPLGALPVARAQVSEELGLLLDEVRQLEAGIPAPRRAAAMADGTGWNECLYIRGNPANPGDKVPRRFLEALGGNDPSAAVPILQASDEKGNSGRLELAARMIDPSNPLLSRVMVNRLWKHHFGEGIVRSVDNFGVLGELPTHPELLDWLAAEFMADGGPSPLPPGQRGEGAWSIKKMHRLMVLSSTYQMASKSSAATGGNADEIDPQNQLLHRMPVRRLEAEAIRDGLLAVSGQLERRLHGPGVLPFLTPHMSGRGRPGASGPLDGAGRRSIYLNVRRNFLTPMFLAFDYPIPFTTIGKRTVSNVPAQALILSNNPLVVQQAELWGRRVLADPAYANLQQQVTALYISAFARPPEPQELADALAFVDEQTRRLGAAKAFNELCHVLFNVKEFIFVN